MRFRLRTLMVVLGTFGVLSLVAVGKLIATIAREGITEDTRLAIVVGLIAASIASVIGLLVARKYRPL